MSYLFSLIVQVTFTRTIGFKLSNCEVMSKRSYGFVGSVIIVPNLELPCSHCYCCGNLNIPCRVECVLPNPVNRLSHVFA